MSQKPPPEAPACSACDVCCTQVFTDAHLKSPTLESRTTESHVALLWKAVGAEVADELRRGKGCRVPGLCLFTLDRSGRVMFELDKLFQQTWGVMSHPLADSSKAPNKKVALAAVAGGLAGSTRRLADHVIKGVVHQAGLLSGSRRKSIALPFHPVGWLVLAGRKATKFVFEAEFRRPLPGLRAKKAATNGRLESALGKASRATTRATTADAADVLDDGGGGPVSPRATRRGRFSTGPADPDPRERVALALADPATSSSKLFSGLAKRYPVHGLLVLRRALRVADALPDGAPGDGAVSKLELKRACDEAGVALAPQSVVDLHTTCGGGSIDELVCGLRGPALPGDRRAAVERMWEVLLTAEEKARAKARRLGKGGLGDGDGTTVALTTFAARLDGDWHPLVMAGRLAEDMCIRQVTAQFDKCDVGAPSGGGLALTPASISHGDFVDYYELVSPFYATDRAFATMLAQAWPHDAWETKKPEPAWEGDGDEDDVLAEEGDADYGYDDGDEDAASYGGYGDDQDSMYSASYAASSPGRGRSRRAPPAVAAGPPDSGYGVAPALGAADLDEADDGDPWQTLRNVLFQPPVTLNDLLNTLNVSGVLLSPVMTCSALSRRLKQLDPRLLLQQADDCAEVAALGTAMPTVQVDRLHAELARKFGTHGGRGGPRLTTFERIRDTVKRLCGKEGIRSLHQALVAGDTSGDGELTRMELKYGLDDFGIELNVTEIDELMLKFDYNSSGTVVLEDVIKGIRGDMSPRRLAMVDQVYDLIDSHGRGEVTMEDLQRRYDPSWHPAVKSKRVAGEVIKREFFAKFDSGDDGLIDKEEWIEFYASVSAMIDGDDYFELYLRQAWHLQDAIEESRGHAIHARNTARRTGARAAAVEAEAERYEDDEHASRLQARNGAASAVEGAYRRHATAKKVEARRRKNAWSREVEAEVEADRRKDSDRELLRGVRVTRPETAPTFTSRALRGARSTRPW